jgi:hypothetical protein
MSTKTVNIIIILILVMLCLSIMANSMSKPIGRDEQMYCTGGILLAQGKMIYRDFSYPSQLPYHPLLYAALFKLLNTTHYLFVGRITSIVCDILVMLCIVGIYCHIFSSFRISGALLGLSGAVLYVFNPLVDYANGYAWNHDVVILCVVLSFWLFITTDFQQKSQYYRIAAIGALLTFASCMRITTALLYLVFFAAVLSQPAESIKQKLKSPLLFLAASVIVLIWPIWVVAQAPRAFFLNLYWTPYLYGRWLHEIGMVYNKGDLIVNCIARPGYLVLLIIAVYLCIAVMWQRRWKKEDRKRSSEPRALASGTDRTKFLLAALLPIAFFIIALIPPTMWRQYLAMPAPFLIISFAYPLFYLRSSEFAVHCSLFRISCAILGICVVVAVASHPVVFYRMPILLVPEYWTPIQVHNISEEIAKKLKTRNSKLILTLAPLLALEGGCDIYDELSAGPIVYRIADRLSVWNRDIANTVGPRTLKKLIEKSPPSAVILGVEMESLEEPLFQTAIQPNEESWERKVYENGPVVYFRR